MINEMQSTLNELINKNDLSVRTTELSNELLGTLKTLEDCTDCKDDTRKFSLDGRHKLINKIESFLAKIETKEKRWGNDNTVDELNNELFEIDNKLNNEVLLCKSCKKEVKKLTDECGNKEVAKFLYQYKLNEKWSYDIYIRWIPFYEFRNIEYLAKCDFGEIHKATKINYRYDKYSMKYESGDVVLKRIYNSSDKIVDVLKEVKYRC